jgi:predicted peptidase
MKIYKIYLLIIIVILLTACKENPTEQLFELNALLTEEMVNAVNMDQGVRVDSFNLKGGIVWDYTISIPEIHDGDDVPLIIGLHWYGEKEGEQYLRCLADPGFKKLNAIIFAPDAGEYYFWEEGNYSLILTLIEYAKKYWPIDESKIVVSGYSNGGIAAWFFGTNYPETFSAAIPMASINNYNKKLNIPFYVIHGENDELFPLSETQSLVNDLESEGADIRLVVVDGLSHYTPCSYDNSLRFASNWLLNYVWK